jgi:preprotein translocase subunit YajC
MSTSLIATTLASAAAAPGGGGAFIVQILPLLLVFVIFYFLMIRPQQRRMKEHAATIAAVQKGDQVITAGGIRGKVTKVADDEVEVEIAQGIKVRIVKSTLSHVLDKNSKPAND